MARAKVTNIRPAAPAKKVVIAHCEEALHLVVDLINQHHPHLGDAKIMYLTTTDTRVKRGKPILGTTGMLGPLQRFLSSGDKETIEDGFDFILMISYSDWAAASPSRKRALLDHLLSYCGEKFSKKGIRRWTINPPDIEEFSAVVERQGLWHIDVRNFVEVARQLPLEAAIQ